MSVLLMHNFWQNIKVGRKFDFVLNILESYGILCEKRQSEEKIGKVGK